MSTHHDSSSGSPRHPRPRQPDSLLTGEREPMVDAAEGNPLRRALRLLDVKVFGDRLPGGRQAAAASASDRLRVEDDRLSVQDDVLRT